MHAGVRRLSNVRRNMKKSENCMSDAECRQRKEKKVDEDDNGNEMR